MRKIRDVLRLSAGGLSKRRIAASLAIGATSVGEYLQRARVADGPAILHSNIRGPRYFH